MNYIYILTQEPSKNKRFEMKDRLAAEEFIKTQFPFNLHNGRLPQIAPEDKGNAERLEKLKRGAFHYGRVELRELMDYIYKEK